MRRLHIFVLLILMLVASCDKEDESSPEYHLDCSSLSVALLAKIQRK